MSNIQTGTHYMGLFVTLVQKTYHYDSNHIESILHKILKSSQQSSSKRQPNSLGCLLFWLLPKQESYLCSLEFSGLIKKTP